MRYELQNKGWCNTKVFKCEHHTICSLHKGVVHQIHTCFPLSGHYVADGENPGASLPLQNIMLTKVYTYDTVHGTSPSVHM